MPRAPAEPRLNGVLVVAKEPGPTSHDIVALVRRLSGVKRVGHGGTLDPFAAGVLPVFVGLATRLVEYHLADEKQYRAVICFGARSTTDDLDGELTPSDTPAPGRSEVEAALGTFLGKLEQVPPDYSAVRVGGRRAYELARHGSKPELRPRRVTIRQLDLTAWDESDAERPIATVQLHCSAGTYVRALARDLGEKLGCGAYLGALTRTASGPFRLEHAHSVERIRQALNSGELEPVLLPPDTGLDDFPRVQLEQAQLDSLARGQAVRLQGAQPEGRLRVVDQDGRLAAIGRLSQGLLHPEKVFHALPN